MPRISDFDSAAEYYEYQDKHQDKVDELMHRFRAQDDSLHAIVYHTADPSAFSYLIDHYGEEHSIPVYFEWITNDDGMPSDQIVMVTNDLEAHDSLLLLAKDKKSVVNACTYT